MSLQADASLIGVGWVVWRKPPVDDADPETLPPAVGGVVCRIDATSWIDSETGEVCDSVAFVCRDPASPKIPAVLFADQIDPSDAQPPSSKRCHLLARRLCWEVGKAPTSRQVSRGFIGRGELESLKDAIALIEAMG